MHYSSLSHLDESAKYFETDVGHNEIVFSVKHFDVVLFDDDTVSNALRSQDLIMQGSNDICLSVSSILLFMWSLHRSTSETGAQTDP